MPLQVILLPLVSILVFVFGLGMLAWLRMKKEDRDRASRRERRAQKKARGEHGEQPGDVIVSDLSLEDLQGCWRMVSIGRNGNFAPPEFLQQHALRLCIEESHFSVDGTRSTGTLRIDRSQNPVHLDQCDDDGDTHLCIVRFRNGELEMCQGNVGAERPQNFNSNRQDGASLTRFARLT